MEKVLLDTDIGSDIDDAVCLAYLLAQPECDLLGITTVTGEPERRAMMASALCRAAGRQVPIYPGAAAPLLVEQQQKQAPQAAALERWPHDRAFPAGEAVHFLSRTIRRHPGEVTLLAIGPLTNVGLLFATDPEVAPLLKRLVLMCGAFARAGREWNAMGDPHATAITYRAPVAAHRSIGLDVTLQVRLDAAAVRQRFTAAPLRPVLDFAEVWFRSSPVLTFHDPLAAVTIFDEGVCGFEAGEVSVETQGALGAGLTVWRPGVEPRPHQVATTVDAARFFERYFAVF
ncbi:MAG: nucleoside hydrolase [Gemmatimonadota bacterium]